MEPVGTSLFMSQVTVSAMIVWLFNQLEQRKIVPANTPASLKRIVAWGAALVAALGLQWEFDTTTGAFVLAGTIQGVGHGLWIWLQSIVVQEGIHQTTKSRAAVDDFLKGQAPQAPFGRSRGVQ
jgi:hypothetical protein